ncbi:MmgE/PrpD family protein [Phenylobacterium sp.]|uniref:MmgE/PrpD family protein n=1 Tax=Phenylobacterium sp. TaxID=1871053 RepID=UPI0025F7210D|nr:MmgE/PrpD family protein [Phenylobacterium sp.]
MTATVSARLAGFLRAQCDAGPPPEVLHEAARLLINQLKASVGAMGHPAVAILHDWARSFPVPDASARILWFGDAAGPEQAAVVNGALFEVLDFNETYIPCFMHAVSGVLPSVLAAAEIGGQSGADVVKALALGIEAELACAAMLMPTGYFRGFIPGGLTGAIGGAAACSLLLGLDETRTRNAIGLAMNSGMGFYQSAGSMALPYVMGMTARNGFTIAQLAARGMDAPAAAFEGDKGMLSAYSDEPAAKIDTVMDGLGGDWRILGQSYKTVPTETITHGPIECVLALLKRAGGRTPETLTFKVAPIVVKIAEERAARFGAPTTDLEARFDLKHCAAAAWRRGRFTLAEMNEAAFRDADILDLRARTVLEADETQATFDGAGLEVRYADGSSDSIFIPNFRGTPGNPMSDLELSEVFRVSAEGVLSGDRSQAVLDAAWDLPRAADIHTLMSLASVR